jgi:hypothetical protein
VLKSAAKVGFICQKVNEGNTFGSFQLQPDDAGCSIFKKFMEKGAEFYSETSVSLSVSVPSGPSISPPSASKSIS